MELRNCKKCGTLFAYDGWNKVCPKCRNKDEEDFKKVREYLYENPGANIQLVSEDTGVEVKKILKYLKEGRLEIKNENTNLILDCERCGKPIKSGRFCEKCKVEIERELKGAIAKNEVKNQSSNYKSADSKKMYIVDRHNK